MRAFTNRTGAKPYYTLNPKPCYGSLPMMSSSDCIYLSVKASCSASLPQNTPEYKDPGLKDAELVMKGPLDPERNDAKWRTRLSRQISTEEYAGRSSVKKPRIARLCIPEGPSTQLSYTLKNSNLHNYYPKPEYLIIGSSGPLRYCLLPDPWASVKVRSPSKTPSYTSTTCTILGLAMKFRVQDALL